VLKRSDSMVEFGLSSLHCIPFEGGILEYGVPKETALAGVTLEAMLTLECQASGAGYAIYWTRSPDNKAVVAGSYTSDAFKAELEARGRVLTFPEASESFSPSLVDLSPVAEVLRTRKPVFIADVPTCDGEQYFQRRGMAIDYSVQSIAFLPVLGGVIEIGTSSGPSTREWKTIDDAVQEQIPNSAVERAFVKDGATYSIFWSRNFATGHYEQVASFESTDNMLSKKKAVESSFTSESQKVRIPIMSDGPVAAAGKSGVDVVIPEVTKMKQFKRKKLAEAWGVGKMTLVPCATGVLEYGTVTKDKRTTTLGSEFAEASRPYRRDVFGTDEWVQHRSTSRFRKAVRTVFQSGVVRAKYLEMLFSMFIAVVVTLWNHVIRARLLPQWPALMLNLNLFTLTAPALGLLITFRTNTCYGRWDEARKTWGSIINKTRNLVRQANQFFDNSHPGYGNFMDARRRVAAETSAFTRCLRAFLRGKADESNLRAELNTLGFTPEEIDGYMSAGNRQVYALSQISTTIRTQKLLDPLERSRMDATISALLDDVGACERIFKTPIPRVYTAHTTRFVGLWLFLLPFAINTASIVPIIATGVISFFFLGIEELGVQIEEPFSVLPLESFCDASIGATLDAMVLTEDKARARDARTELNLRATGTSGVVTPAMS